LASWPVEPVGQFAGYAGLVVAKTHQVYENVHLRSCPTEEFRNVNKVRQKVRSAPESWERHFVLRSLGLAFHHQLLWKHASRAQHVCSWFPEILQPLLEHKT